MATVEWGLSQVAFWRLTPREFAALARQAAARERREDARTAGLMALMAELLAPRKDGKHYAPADFMPKREKPKPEAQDWRLMKAMAMAHNAANGGRFVTREEA